MGERGLCVRWDGGERRGVYDGMEGRDGSIGGTGDGWTMGRWEMGCFFLEGVHGVFEPTVTSVTERDTSVRETWCFFRLSFSALGEEVRGGFIGIWMTVTGREDRTGCPCGQGRATACVRTRSSPWWSSICRIQQFQTRRRLQRYCFYPRAMSLCGWTEGFIWEQQCDKAEGLFVRASV